MKKYSEEEMRGGETNSRRLREKGRRVRKGGWVRVVTVGRHATLRGVIGLLVALDDPEHLKVHCHRAVMETILKQVRMYKYIHSTFTRAPHKHAPG